MIRRKPTFFEAMRSPGMHDLYILSIITIFYIISDLYNICTT